MYALDVRVILQFGAQIKEHDGLHEPQQSKHPTVFHGKK